MINIDFEPPIKLNDADTRKIAASVVHQAVLDLENLCERMRKVKEAWRQKNLAGLGPSCNWPFGQEDDNILIAFFDLKTSNMFAFYREILDMDMAGGLPYKLRKMMNAVREYKSWMRATDIEEEIIKRQRRPQGKR